MMRLWIGVFFMLLLTEVGVAKQCEVDSLFGVLNSLEDTSLNAAKARSKLFSLVPTFDEKLTLAKQQLEAGQKVGSYKRIGGAQIMFGNAYLKMGDLSKAYQYFLEAISSYQQANYSKGIHTAYHYLSLTLVKQGNYDLAIEYTSRSVEAYKADKDTIRFASLLLNMGELLREKGAYLSAIDTLQKARFYLTKVDFQVGVAYANGNIGLAQAKLYSLDSAEVNLNAAIEALLPLNDDYALSFYYGGLADVFSAKGQTTKAIELAHKSCELAAMHNMTEQLRNGYHQLAQLYALTGNYDKAYANHELYTLYKDSLVSEKSIQEVENLRRQFEVAQKQAEVDALQKKQHLYKALGTSLIATMVLMAALIVVLYAFQKKRKRNNAILRKQQAELQKLNATKDHLFAIISHDLRSPIATFQSFMEVFELMVKEGDPEELLKLASEMNRSSNVVVEMVDNLFKWGLSQKGEIPFHPVRLDISACIHQTLAGIQPSAKNKRIYLTQVSRDECMVVVDKIMLEAIIRNLVNNAIKFTPSGGSVEVDWQAVDDGIEVSVTDTGVGIAEDKIKGLFELDLEKSTYGTDNEKGFGLGLRIVKEFVDKHNGFIRIKSELGSGTTFTIVLPQAVSTRMLSIGAESFMSSSEVCQ